MESHSTSSGPGALWFLGLIVVLTLVNACFSMAETALVSLSASRIELMVEEGRRGAKVLKKLKENPPRFIATTQIGITILGFASAAEAATTLAEPLEPWMHSALHLSVTASHAIAVPIVTLFVALLTMVLGEIAPKSLAVQAPDAWALRLAPFINFCATIFTPITWLVVGLSGLLVRPFGATAGFETPFITREEYEHLLASSAKHGELDDGETDIITNVLDLAETQIRTVMTARPDIKMLPVEAGLPEMLELILDSGHSRVPVYEGTVDNIVGIVHAKDLLPLLRTDSHSVDLRAVMREPDFVPRNKSVKDLLEEFRRGSQQMAIVLDDSGGTAGLVTLEDLLEEIVGEIRDETDKRDEPELKRLSPNEALIDGRMGINDVNDRLEVELPTDSDTIGGLVFGLIGHVALPGDRARLDDIEFIVESVDRRRIRTIRAILHTPEDATTPASAETPEVIATRAETPAKLVHSSDGA